MLDINAWFFAQLANFLLLLIVLNIILFKPILRIIKEREENTTGALENAKALDREKDEVLGRIDEKLSEGRGNAKTVYEGLSREGLETQKETLESAQNEAVEINRNSREELEAATEKARAGLQSDIETFSKQIVDKLVGAK